MRERSLNFAIWVLGFGVAIIWLLLSGVSLTIPQKIILTVFVIIISTLAIYFLNAIKKGFDSNRKLMIDIERILGCHKKGVYIDSRPLFPEEYADNKRDTSRFKTIVKALSSHFVSIYIWIVIIALLIALLIWMSPNQQNGKEGVTSSNYKAGDVKK